MVSMGAPASLLSPCVGGWHFRLVRNESSNPGASTTRLQIVRRPVACLIQGLPQSRKRASHQENLRPCAALGSVGVASSSPALVTVAATVVGYMVVTGSMVRSVPQIIRVIRNKSADGISVISIVSQAVALLITTMYNWKKNYPFSSYGDAVTCNIQNLILLGVIFRFRPEIKLSKIVFCSLLGIAFAVYLSVGATPSQLWILQASTMGIDTIGGKIPQIVSNIRRGDSGELSIVTSALNVAGFVARTFTHLVLTKDMLNLTGSTVLGLLNVYIFHQTLVTAGAYGTRLPRKKTDKTRA